MNTRRDNIRAPRGRNLNSKGWIQEAALRMLMNNLDPEVAENPQELIIYGGSGKAARNWESYEAIVKTLKILKTMRLSSCNPVNLLPCSELIATLRA